MYVAVVDDEIDLLYLFKDALSEIDGIQVIAFSDPYLAFEHFRLNHQDYRVVVADYRMPGMNGIQLIDKMKTINSGVTCILISAFEIEDKVIQNCQCVDKFLQKPISIFNLIDEVEKGLKTIQFQKIDNRL
jgi:DNA-binding NtrC family response regulator